MSRKIISACMLAMLLLQVSNVFSQETVNWAQFRGVNQNGISPETNLPDKLPANGPKLLWKNKVGDSFAELCYVDGTVYTMISEMTDSASGFEYLAAFNAKTGKELWREKVDSLYIDPDSWGDGSRGTPYIEKDVIYTFSGFGKLTASSRKNGKMIWQVDIMKDFDSHIPRWGYSSSPLVVGDIVIIEAGGTENRAVAAFNKKDGSFAWANGTGGAGYSTPVILELNGEKQIVITNQISSTMFSFNTKGDTLWTINHRTANGYVNPILVGENRLFLSTVYGGYTVVDVTDNKPKVVLEGMSMKNHCSTSVYYEGHIYGFHAAALQCINLETGEKKWTKRGYGKGSLTMADGKLYVLSDRGKLIQVKATPEAYIEQGAFQAVDGKCWTAPSIANGKLFVRNLTEMTCYELR